MRILYQLTSPMEKTVLGAEEVSRRREFLRQRAALGVEVEVRSLGDGPASIESAWEASLVVPALCEPEAHPGLHHLVSTVRGRRRAGTGIGALVRATFPPASVTGAPKPRVMQIIEDLEPVRRGVYCGAIGWIDTVRDAGDLNVAIRTFTVAHERTQLGIGAGIVADSEPASEWAETELKAARLLAAASGDLAGAPDPTLAGARR